MALIIIGSSKCALCHQVVLSKADIMALPPISQTGNPLYQYFDCVVHIKCFDSWNKKPEVLKIIADEHQKFINSDYYKDKVKKYGKPKWAETPG